MKLGHEASLDPLTRAQQITFEEVKEVIGPSKPLTSIGGRFIIDHYYSGGPEDVLRLESALLKEGYFVKTKGVVDDPDSDLIREAGHWLQGGTLIVADQDELQQLLDRNREVLEENDWPTDIEGFVETVFIKQAPPHTPLYDLVADAYGDRYNPQRTDYIDPS